MNRTITPPHSKSISLEMSELESYFSIFRKDIIGIDQRFDSPYGEKKIVYADWTASGRLFGPIEDKLKVEIGPYVANTHTETTTTGCSMTLAYHEAREIIKRHVGADHNDVLITEGSGMTGAINKFQRILGLKVSENLKEHTTIPDEKRPIVFISHMEHHSNQTSWLETIAKVVVIPFNEDGLICLESFEALLSKYDAHPIKIASITACSNVTGIITDYHAVARLTHQHNGLCFVDFACSAPYVDINMHPQCEEEHLDGIFFSPHKFLGGPGSPGVLIFNKKLYKNLVPDNPGGGTVKYTNPWGDHDYIEDIELREDGGTPGFLQTIKAALAIKLKDKMGVDNIINREHELTEYIIDRLENIDQLTLLAPKNKNRLGIFSFYFEEIHYNLIVRMLNDRYGIQTRGGCSCAGTYGHYLLNVNEITSKALEIKILEGCLADRPGWIRMSIHPTMTNEEAKYICDSIEELALNMKSWSKEYQYNPLSNEFEHIHVPSKMDQLVKGWFDI
jgi:selenocysteine lyase/cysteine desulfurase